MSDLAARLTAISDAVLSGYTLRDSAAECCTDAADALERLTHDLAEAERMARLGNASTQQLRDALERAERRAEYWKAEHNAANAEANILARQVNAAEVIAEKARVFVAAQREAGEPDHTPDEASAYAALVAAIQRVRE